MKNRISELKDYCQGRPVAVLGGGPSLPGDMAKLPAGVFLMSVNGHSLRLQNADMLVFCDNPYRGRAVSLKKAFKSFAGPKVSTIDDCSDYIFDVPYWDGGFTSTVAAWLADFMGGDPILLCGMDCYQGEEKYFFDDWRETKSYHPCFDYPLENNLKAWAPAFMFMDNADKLKAVSGPLGELFGIWQGA